MANSQINFDVLSVELHKSYTIICYRIILFKVKNKALELLGQDYKENYSKIFWYMHANLEL